jgi:hypothetical protein
LVAGFAAATLLLAAVPAGASDSTFAATADAGGLSIDIAGEPLLEVGITSAAMEPGAAAALGIPGALGGEGFGAREAVSEGARVDDAGCEAELPGELGAFLSADAFCADAVAHADDRYAFADAGAADVLLLEADADDLAPLLDLLGQLGLDAALQELLVGLDEQLVEEVDALLEHFEGDVLAEYGALVTDCTQALEPLSVAGALDGHIAALEGATPDGIAASLADIGPLVEELPEACAILLVQAEIISRLLVLLDETDVTELVGQLQSSLVTLLASEGGIAGVELLSTGSSVGTDDEVVDAVAAADGTVSLFVDLDLLGALDVLAGDVLDTAVAELGDLQDELASAVTGLKLEAPVFPVVGDVGTVLTDLLGTDLLARLAEEGVDREPLLEVIVTPSDAWVEYDRSTGEYTHWVEPAIVELGGTLFSLPGLEDVDGTVDQLVGVLDAELLATLDASPLGDVVSVRLLAAAFDEDADVLGLPGVEATSEVVTVSLLGPIGDDPLLEVHVAEATAAVGVGEADGVIAPGDGPCDGPGDGDVVTAGPDPDPAAPSGKDPLPVTGGGAALLGLAAIGAAAALRRRG